MYRKRLVASSGVDLGLWLLVWVVGEYHVKDHVTFGLLNTIMTQPCSCVNRGGCVGLITEFKIRCVAGAGVSVVCEC